MAEPALASVKIPGQHRGNAGMTAIRRHFMTMLAASMLLAVPAVSQAETVRIGLPTKTYWPTTVAEAAKAQKLFEKEGVTAEITIYRGGAECFEALAAGAADLILDAPALPAAGRKKGVMSKAVANGAMGNFGWQLMVLAKSPLEVKDLNGKKVGITSAGSGSDLLALWTIQDRKIDFTRVPVGGGGLVPNLLAGNIDAAVVYSPRPAPSLITRPRCRRISPRSGSSPTNTPRKSLMRCRRRSMRCMAA
jgi:ABC-type nitrate/sulfonate/bicarbonate transport system substrate-binding protein